MIIIILKIKIKIVIIINIIINIMAFLRSFTLPVNCRQRESQFPGQKLLLFC